jgi:LysM repeat protein
VFSVPLAASAGVASLIGGLFTPTAEAEENHSLNSQTMPLLEATESLSTSSDAALFDLMIDDQVLIASAGPLGTIADVPEPLPAADQITIYTVHEGETIGQIASMFKISADTIRWANDLKATATVTPEQVLLIPPVSGVIHEVKKGDTVASIAKLYGANADSILEFNDLGGATELAIGDSLIVPDGKILPKKPATANNPIAGYFMRPIKGGRKTTGIHGRNGVDLAAPAGNRIYAAAPGKVVISRVGWNGGFGNYVVINHPNGTQTLYAHASTLLVKQGEYVERGQVIGTIGSTGRSTGPHLHFEVHGAKNPF